MVYFFTTLLIQRSVMRITLAMMFVAAAIQNFTPPSHANLFEYDSSVTVLTSTLEF